MQALCESLVSTDLCSSSKFLQNSPSRNVVRRRACAAVSGGARKFAYASCIFMMPNRLQVTVPARDLAGYALVSFTLHQECFPSFSYAVLNTPNAYNSISAGSSAQATCLPGYTIRELMCTIYDGSMRLVPLVPERFLPSLADS